MQTTYEYYWWASYGGRLYRITSGTPYASQPDPTKFQDLYYNYDTVGNILHIYDYKAGPQTQTFGYDPLYRLLSANATGESDGLYSEGYTYNTANGNLLTKNGLTYTYDSNHKHAVATLSNGNTYGYDSNGNMTQRHVYESGAWKDYTLSYDAENHLTNVTGAATAQFTYNGDGQRVKSFENGTTKVYIGNYFEWSGSIDTMKRYYYAGATRVAMREGNDEPLLLLGDHLGSTNKVANYDGTWHGTQNYKAWGETRFVEGDIPTDFHFTGQREDSYIKLYWYGSRWYDPSLGRFIQADTIIPNPGNPLMYDRYSYVRSNPLRFADPSGHAPVLGECDYRKCISPLQKSHPIYLNLQALEYWEIMLIALGVYCESGNGTHPQEAMAAIAEALRNRKYNEAWKDDLWKAVVDGALSTILCKAKNYQKGKFILPDSYDKENVSWKSKQDMIDFIKQVYDTISQGAHAKGLRDAMAATIIGIRRPISNLVYFSHQKSAGRHETPEERWDWIKQTVALRDAVDPTFEYYYYGPYYVPTQGLTMLLIVSNVDICGFYGSCGPPWPPSTP